MKYLKFFETHSDYETYISGNVLKPNVSYCEDMEEIHYNPWEDTRIVAKFNVTSTSEATYIMDSTGGATSYFSEIEIDGVVQQSVVSSYTFSTTGEHMVKYTLSNPALIGDGAFNSCTTLTSVIIPGSLTVISSALFSGCSALTSVTISEGVQNITNTVFKDCSSLTQITIPASVSAIGK